jgi:xanthine dehydrogenase accessory factor
MTQVRTVNASRCPPNLQRRSPRDSGPAPRVPESIYRAIVELSGPIHGARLLAKKLQTDFPVLVRGAGDVGSAVAVHLFRAGYAVALHDEPAPPTLRRGMAFVDAIFDGQCLLDGVLARRIDQAGELGLALLERKVVPITTIPFQQAVGIGGWAALVDARLRKRTVPETQRGLAPLTIGLGPNFIARQNVDLAIETSWGDTLGGIIRDGATLPFVGEPRALGGVSRDRFVYAPASGVFEATTSIGAYVVAGDTIAKIGSIDLRVPVTGIVRGLTRSGVEVTATTKVIEIDPRGDPSEAFGLGERPRRIAEGVCRALEEMRAR